MRIKTIQILFAISFIFLAACLYYLQIIKGPGYKDLSYRNSIRLLNVDAPRGVIYGRRHEAIAKNELSFGVFVVPQEVEDIDREIVKLAKILEVKESLLKRNYKRNYRAPFASCELLLNVTKQKAILVKELNLDMPGIIVRELPLRTYPFNKSLAHVVGYLGEIDKRELELLKSYGYSARDLIGKDGIEKWADTYLRGKDGGMQIQVDNRGRQVEVLNSKKHRRGRDVYLTIDAKFQNFLWKMMRGNSGCAIFMDPRNGEILGMVSSPSYDPNGSLARVMREKGAPLFNRAILGRYPPGSLFKIVVAFAGLETGVVAPETTFLCDGGLNLGTDRYNCWKRDGHGYVDVDLAIIESCNVYFYNLGLLLKAENITKYAKDFGFGRRTGIELVSEDQGFVPTRSWKRMDKGESWYAGDTANFSIGQGYLLTTPLQVARMISSIANGGYLIEPHIIKKVGDVDILGHKKTALKIKEENLELISKAMKGVVNETDGTGIRAWSEYVSISGKTGTSQAGGDLRSHAWFAGFAPSENPEIAFVVFLEHGGSGGDMPALITKKSMGYWFRN
jgi:penicillin-binding protein 2